ncbi:hypothetical protein [Streptomyces chryseus]
MTLRFLGTTSDGGDCPTLYEVEKTGDILVQGEKVTDPEHLALLRDVKQSETPERDLREIMNAILYVDSAVTPQAATARNGSGGRRVRTYGMQTPSAPDLAQLADVPKSRALLRRSKRQADSTGSTDSTLARSPSVR